MSEESERTSTWRADLGAGVVVALIALPLCLGIALASGAPLMAGLITGVIGGLLVSVIGGTQLLVSGPAAGLAAIVIAAIADLGSFEALLATLVVAGVLQVALGLVRAGSLAAYVPTSVVTGMLAAIGVLLILQQIPHALGAVPEQAHGLGLIAMPFRAVGDAKLGPALIALVALGVLLAFDRPALAPLKKRLPGPVVAVAIGTLLAEGLARLPATAFEARHRVVLPPLHEGLDRVLLSPDWSALATPTAWRVAVTIAIVASLETLLSLEATDTLDPWRRRSKPNRELLAQGIGNTLAGLIGGLPMTGVIVRSATNIGAGGRTWRAAFIHGVLLASAVIALPGLLSHIPLAALSAVLIHTGWKLAHPSRFREAFAAGRAEAVPLTTTVAVVVATDLLAGVAAGLGVAYLLARRAPTPTEA